MRSACSATTRSCSVTRARRARRGQGGGVGHGRNLAHRPHLPVRVGLNSAIDRRHEHRADAAWPCPPAMPPPSRPSPPASPQKWHPWSTAIVAEPGDLDPRLDALTGADRVFVLGAGRSGRCPAHDRDAPDAPGARRARRRRHHDARHPRRRRAPHRQRLRHDDRSCGPPRTAANVGRRSRRSPRHPDLPPRAIRRRPRRRSRRGQARPLRRRLHAVPGGLFEAGRRPGRGTLDLDALLAAIRSRRRRPVAAPRQPRMTHPQRQGHRMKLQFAMDTSPPKRPRLAAAAAPHVDILELGTRSSRARAFPPSRDQRPTPTRSSSPTSRPWMPVSSRPTSPSTAGADLITVLGSAGRQHDRGAVKAAKKHGKGVVRRPDRRRRQAGPPKEVVPSAPSSSRCTPPRRQAEEGFTFGTLLRDGEASGVPFSVAGGVNASSTPTCRSRAPRSPSPAARSTAPPKWVPPPRPCVPLSPDPHEGCRASPAAPRKRRPDPETPHHGVS